MGAQRGRRAHCSLSLSRPHPLTGPMETIDTENDVVTSSEDRRLPRWVVPAVVVFWSGFLGAMAVRFVWSRLSGLFLLLVISVFLALAIEPGVNRLARRGWKRGRATALILFGVMAMF